LVHVLVLDYCTVLLPYTYKAVALLADQMRRIGDFKGVGHVLQQYPEVSEVSWYWLVQYFLLLHFIYCDPLFMLQIPYFWLRLRIFEVRNDGCTYTFSIILVYDTGFNARTYISNSSHHTLDSSSDGTTIVDLTTVLLLATLIILFLLLWVYLKYVTNSGFLVLEIGNATTSVRIRCLSLHSAIYASVLC